MGRQEQETAMYDQPLEPETTEEFLHEGFTAAQEKMLKEWTYRGGVRRPLTESEKAAELYPFERAAEPGLVMALRSAFVAGAVWGSGAGQALR